MSSTASDTSAAMWPNERRSLRARVSACRLATLLGAFACGGQANQHGSASNGGAPASGGSTSSGGAGQPSSATGAAPAGGSTTSGGSSTSGGSTSAGTNGDGWTLPHTADKTWRNSKEPLCNPTGFGLPLDLWSDERGLFVLTDTGMDEFGVAFNDGNGWSVVPHAKPTFYGITGFRDGSLVLYASERCGVAFGSGADERCVAALPGVAQAFVVDDTRIFAVAGNRMLHYNGSYFTQYGKALPEATKSRLSKLWADADVVLALTDGGSNLYSFADESEPIALPLPGGEPAFSLWAFSRDDIWVGLANNRLAHYDGQSFTVQQLGLACGNVNALWGSDGVLFAASSTFVGKVTDGKVQAIAEASRCPPETSEVGQFEELVMRKIWGNSPSEVFFAVTERRFDVMDDGVAVRTTVIDPDACGMQRLYWYDGARLRPL